MSNTDIDNYLEYKPSKTTSLSVDYDLWLEAKRNNIALKNALDLGLSIILAEKGIVEMPDFQLNRNLKKTVDRVAQLCSEIENLRSQIDLIKKDKELLSNIIEKNNISIKPNPERKEDTILTPEVLTNGELDSILKAQPILEDTQEKHKIVITPLNDENCKDSS